MGHLVQDAGKVAYNIRIGNGKLAIYQQSCSNVSTLPVSGDMSVLDDGVVEVTVEDILDVGHVLDLGDATSLVSMRSRDSMVASDWSSY